MGPLKRTFTWTEPVWMQGANKATLSLTSSIEYEKIQWKAYV